MTTAGAPRAVTLIAAVVALVALGPARPAGAAAITVGSAALRPGSTVVITGSGFQLPDAATCEVAWSGPRLPDSTCFIREHAFAMLPLEAAAGVLPGSYAVTVCAPSCAHPWAGRDTGVLTVVSPSPALSSPPLSSPPPPVSPPPVAPQLVTPPLPLASTPPSSPQSSPPPPGPHVAAAPPTPAGDGGDLRLAVATDNVLIFPDPATPTDTVRLRDSTLPRSSGSCAFAWDGLAVPGACAVDGQGRLGGQLRIPAHAAPGRHRVIACYPDCGDPVGGTAPAVITVAAGLLRGSTDPRVTPAPELMPDLRGLTVAAARAAVAPLGLVLSGIPSGTGRIVGQLPAPGTVVTPGDLVTLSLAPAPASGPASLAASPSAASAPLRSWQWPLGLLLAGVALLSGFAASRALGHRPVAPLTDTPRLEPFPDRTPTLVVRVRLPRHPVPSLHLRAARDDAPVLRTEVVP